VTNLDNDYEMELVDELLKSSCIQYRHSQIGLRINPVVGPGTIESLSTATKSSKFGLPIVSSTRAKVIQLFERYDWLNGVHFHVGSQGVPLSMFVQATKICMDLVGDIEKASGRSLKFVDIGNMISRMHLMCQRL
jgi:diaminopimelate decarboxylase